MASPYTWMTVMLVHLINILLFGYLILYFLNYWKKSEGEAKTIMWVMVTLNSIILVREIYSYISHASDPLASDMFLQEFYPEISSGVGLAVGLIVLFASLTIIWSIRKLTK